MGTWNKFKSGLRIYSLDKVTHKCRLTPGIETIDLLKGAEIIDNLRSSKGSRFIGGKKI